MAPVFAAHWKLLPRLDKPMDGGKLWRGQRLLGDHKTIRGFIVGWLAALIFVLVQAYIYDQSSTVRDWYPIDFSDFNLVLWATLLSLGALGGDLVKSFFKRRLNIAPGKPWVPFDQTDYVAGTLLASLAVIVLPLRYYLIAAVLGLVLHPISTFLGWIFKLKDTPI